MDHLLPGGKGPQDCEPGWKCSARKALGDTDILLDDYSVPRRRNGHNYIGCGLDLIEGGLYAALKRIVVTCAGWSPEDEIDIRTPLHGMFLRFPEPGLEVQYKVAKSSD